MRAFSFVISHQLKAMTPKPVHLARFFRTSCLHCQKTHAQCLNIASTLVELADTRLIGCGDRSRFSVSVAGLVDASLRRYKTHGWSARRQVSCSRTRKA
jgi:hypothetical protein